ncbi:DUF4129 domain-containing protein [Cellulomonas sp. URHB0016]
MTLAVRAGGPWAMLRSEVPVEPDASTARRWAQDELADPVYHQSRSLLERLIDWLVDMLNGIPAPVVSSWASLALVIGIAVAVAVAVLWFLGPVRRSRAAAAGSGRAVLGRDDTRTAAELRTAADAASAAGDWSLAVVERFRAVVRDLEERTVLDARLGRTAHEATVAAAVRLPSLGDELSAGGRLFDDVAYGHVEATAADDDLLRALDRDVRGTRPVAPARRSAAPLEAAR